MKSSMLQNRCLYFSVSSGERSVKSSAPRPAMKNVPLMMSPVSGSILFHSVSDFSFDSSSQTRAISSSKGYIACRYPPTVFCMDSRLPSISASLGCFLGSTISTFIWFSFLSRMRGSLFCPLALWFLVQSDANCRVFLCIAPDVRSDYRAKSLNAASLCGKFVQILKECRACFCNRNCFNSRLSHCLNKVAHVCCPRELIAFKFAAVVVKVEFVSPVGFKCSPAQLGCIVLRIYSEVFKVVFNLFVHGVFLQISWFSVGFPFRCVVYYRISGI
nr:MAG TPA: hypothetical protein [Caudoviricetes sp.]